MVENSPQAIISLLAILKAGGAYLPLNTEYPVERKKYMIADSQVKLLLTNCKDEAIMFQPGLTLIDLQDHAIYEHKNTFAGFAVNPDSQGDGLAYIMYTSGSTGAPKGVMVKHRNVIRLVRNTNFFQFKKDDRLLLTGALEFDASTFETWGPLLNGLPLHMVNKDTILSPDKLKEAIQKNNINLMWLTSPLFNQLLDTDMEIFAGIRNLLVGGDVLSPSHIYRAKKRFPHLNIINGYGPTENTTFSTTYLIEDEYRENIPIGKPLANSTAYILDASYNLVPIGAPGELYVGGDGLSLGYLNRPELTAEKFDQDLWDVCDNQDKRNKSFFGWARGAVFSKKAPLFYKTGDLARLLSDGNIEFLGRLDYQVKIRGYRIEPGEIEKHLKQFHFISEAVVIDRKNKDDEKYLCAYLVLAEEEKEKFDAVELRKKLSLNLPDYMVPSHFVRLEKIPLNINGKVDKKALPEPEITLGDTVYIGPRNLVEEKFIEIWSEVLRIEKEKISIDSNFFELGGHSLKATIVISKLNKTFDIKIPLAELFKIPTIRELAEFIKKLKKDAFASIKEAEEKEYYELSAAQKRHYFLHQLEQDNIIYNVPFKTILKGKSNPDHIEQIFKKLIKRHESLRTSFQMLNNKPVQRISKDVEFQIEVLEITKQKPDLLTGLMQNFIRSFDLSRAPLMRVGILPKKEEEFILIVDMHHIITDGTSISLLVDEFIQLYKGLELPILKLQYKDYAEWQNSEPEKEKRQKQEKYWLQEFKKEISTLELPIDYPRPLTQNFDGDSFPFEISPDHAGALNSLVMTENSTLFMILLAIYYILLAKLSGQEDIIIGTPIAGRRHADLEKIVGMFVNSLGLRNFPNGNKTFREFLNEVRKKTLEAFENQDYQFENLVELVLVNRDFSRNPIFDVMFIFQNFTVSSGDFQDMVENAARKTNLAADELDDFIKISKFDLSLTVQEKDKKSFFSWQYCTKLFKKETVERFTMYFKKIISIILKDPNIKICDIEIISEKEKKEVIYTFNSSDTIYPGNKMIHQLFDEQVAHAPGRVALYGVYEANKFNKTHLTYLELQKSSASLAQSLSKRGVSHDTIVGIMAERTVEVIIGILGILKSGGAYLPIDPEYPQERIEYMLKDSNAILLAVAIGLEGEKVRRCEGKKVSSSNLAYVIYTSGSTGRPKAVMVEHRNVVRLVKNTNYVEFKENGHLLQTGALEFDASTFEIWGSLLNGMTLYTAPKDEILNPAKLRAYARKWDIVTMWLTSPLFNQLAGEDVEIFAGLKNLLVGGDVLSPLYINRVRERFPGLNIINGYGPTENTTFSTTFKIDKEYIQRIPIGKPIANSTAFIVDKSNHLVPVGVCGELLVGGDGVSRGYLNNPELTAEKFDQDKINKSFFGGARGAIFSKKAPLIYRTGDLARWLVDGNIEFLGRIDQQVKMRGFRIELEEIESRLIKHPQ
ncbi:MAG: amino acid adenylation domain-containing protein, partial [Acidobacteria bacterium]|nr:amino acid adenylation domain-containing protein [Acidobacteriota bacterium]